MTAQIGVDWRRFDYEDKAATAPPVGEIVWVVKDLYVDGVAMGYFDGFTMRTVDGSDDCRITHWASIAKPDAPQE